MVARAAFAGEPAADADALFDEARELMARGSFAQACPMLERSEALDPGIGTEFNLARCYELAGRLASAWQIYQRVIGETQAAGQTERERVARDLARALEPRLSHVAIRAKEEPPGLELRCDDALVARARWGEPLPLDPGEHIVAATAPGALGWKTTLVIAREAEAIVIDVPVLTAAPSARTLAPRATSRESSDGRASGGTQRTVGALLAGAGLVSAGFGSYFGVRSISRESEATSFCDRSACDPHGFDLRSGALADGNRSTLSFIVGGAFLVAGAIVWLSASPRR
jgi:hypothetical protein